MEDRVIQARVGIVVVSAILLAGILIVFFGDIPSPFRRGNVIYVNFDRAPGVAEGTPVRKSGILVGRVESVQFVEDSSDVIVKIRLKPRVSLYENEVCHINSATLLGDAVLEFIPDPQIPKTKKLIPNGAHLTGKVTKNPMEVVTSLESDLRDTLGSISKAGNDMGELARNINKVFQGADEERIRRLMDKTETALDQFSQTMSGINQILNDDTQQALRQSLDDLPQIMQSTKDALSEIRGVVERADENLENLQGLTGPLGERGEAIAENIESSITQFNRVVGELVTFTERMNSDDGTLGQLINNPELYRNLNSAAANIQKLTTDIRPIMNDIRVFSDKIARDPGQLGVRGALQRNSRTKYPNMGTVVPPPIDWRDEHSSPMYWHESSPIPVH